MRRVHLTAIARNVTRVLAAGDGGHRRPAVAGARWVMALRSGIYIVPTDHWYIERAVWLISGVVLLSSTALAALHDPRWIVFVTSTGLASISVSLNGFCIVGNVLTRLGFKGKLATDPSSKWYFMQTDRWYLERRIYIVVGINITVASILSLVHSPWWLVFTGFVGAAMLWFAGTGFCIMANFLYWLGYEPRLGTKRNATVAAPAAS
jgi:hypothetical protein